MPGHQWLLAMIVLSLSIPGAQLGRAQAPAAGTCTISIEATGGSSVMVSALGCSGDTIGVTATAGGNSRQIPPTSQPDFDLPLSLDACAFGLNHTAPVTYVATVLGGPDKGKTSNQVTAEMAPSRLKDDPPSIASFEGTPFPGNTWVRPGDSIHLTVNLEDDIGLSAIKVTDPTGAVLLDKKLTSAPQKDPCHPQPRYATVDVPVYVVPENPPTPLIQFTAVVRDTAGQESSATATYFTEPVWTGQMLLNGVGTGQSFTCMSSSHIELWVKVSTTNEVSGLGRATHTPLEGCHPKAPDLAGQFYFYSITGNFDGKYFRLKFILPNGSTVYDMGFVNSGLLNLDYATPTFWPSATPWTIEVPVLGPTHAQADHLNHSMPAFKGASGTVSATGWVQLECCSTDTGPEVPTTAPKRPPIYSGADQYDPWNRRRAFGPD